MSYRQAAPQADIGFNNPMTTAMYMRPDPYTRRTSYGQPFPFLQGATAVGKIEHQTVGGVLDQFAGFNIPSSNMAVSTPVPVTSGQLPLSGSQYFYTASGQLVYAGPNLFTGPFPQAPLNDSSYGGYTAPMSLVQQQGHLGYIPGYPILPYTPGQNGYHLEASDHLRREAQDLDNRSFSLSTNESTPVTPYYNSLAKHELEAKGLAMSQSPFGSTPSPNESSIYSAVPRSIESLAYTAAQADDDIDTLLLQHPIIPKAVPAVFTPRESMRTLEQSLSNPIPGNRNVYIRGLHPNTDDEKLAAYASRFGKVETSKAIIDTTTGACKGFGFAKYYDIRDSKSCIQGFYRLGYEVGFARESFNSRLKAEGDETSTNLYVSNLPKDMTEAELGAVFMDYNVVSSRILRDGQGNSRGVGFARFETRDLCEEIIKRFHGQPIGNEGLLLQVRYADTPAQKDLKRVTTERRQFRTNEYNIGAYGGLIEANGSSPQLASPVLPRASQIAQHLPTPKSCGAFRRGAAKSESFAGFKDINRPPRNGNLVGNTPSRNFKQVKSSMSTPAVSETSSGSLSGVKPSMGPQSSPSIRRSQFC